MRVWILYATKSTAKNVLNWKKLQTDFDYLLKARKTFMLSRKVAYLSHVFQMAFKSMHFCKVLLSKSKNKNYRTDPPMYTIFHSVKKFLLKTSYQCWS